MFFGGKPDIENYTKNLLEGNDIMGREGIIETVGKGINIKYKKLL